MESTITAEEGIKIGKKGVGCRSARRVMQKNANAADYCMELHKIIRNDSNYKQKGLYNEVPSQNSQFPVDLYSNRQTEANASACSSSI